MNLDLNENLDQRRTFLENILRKIWRYWIRIEHAYQTIRWLFDYVAIFSYNDACDYWTSLEKSFSLHQLRNIYINDADNAKIYLNNF